MMNTKSIVEKLIKLQELMVVIQTEADQLKADLPNDNRHQRPWQFLQDQFGKNSEFAQMTKSYGGASIAYKIEQMTLFETGKAA